MSDLDSVMFVKHVIVAYVMGLCLVMKDRRGESERFSVCISVVCQHSAVLPETTGTISMQLD